MEMCDMTWDSFVKGNPGGLVLIASFWVILDTSIFWQDIAGVWAAYKFGDKFDRNQNL